jgi:hypothetical protein
MNTDALGLVTDALRIRLEQAAGGLGKVFVGPLDDVNAAQHPLILFLYRIMPNPSLRNREHRVAQNNPSTPVAVFGNPLALDLYYLLTIGAPAQDDAAARLEPLRILGAAMRSLHLDPELDGPELGFEPVHVSFDPLSTEETSRIWALFPTANYRTSVGYIASPVWIDPDVAETRGALVRKDSLDAGVRAPPMAVE